MKKRLKKTSLGEKVFNVCNTLFMILLVIVTLYPFINTIAVSFNDANDTVRGGIYLWPRVLTLYNYRSIFADGTVYHAFFISVSRTVISTVLNIFITCMLAYALSRREYVFRKAITTVFVMTMYFNAGLIPGYILIKNLHLYNSFLVYIIPGMIGVFNLIIIRTHIGSLPESMIEAARIDGAGEFRTFIQVVFPLCKPVLAVVGLLVAVGAWNAWFDTFLFASSNENLATLQSKLMQMLQSTMSTSTSAAGQYAKAGQGADAANNTVTPVSMRAAITIVTATPILIVYPFVQKYFVAMNVGSVKE